MSPSGRTAAQALWVAVPAAIYFYLLQHFWFDAPMWDDFDTILGAAMALADAHTFQDWLRVITFQHNEHRIGVMRLASWGVNQAMGHIDFRALVFIGNLSVVGIFALVWYEFRETVSPALIGAAAFLMFHMGYYEASIMPSAGLPNLGVAFFSIACVFFARRGGVAGAAACIVLGLFAVGSQANGLLALPIAAFGCLLARRYARAGVLGAVALALWIGYFTGYHPVTHHPSPLEVVRQPLVAIKLFLIVVGWNLPGVIMPAIASLGVFAALGWLARKRAWRPFPVPALWLLYAFASIGAVVVGRTGFGVGHAPRYSIYSTTVIVIAFLAIAALTRPWPRARTITAVVACALISFAVTLSNWSAAVEYANRGHVLAKTIPGLREGDAPYVGMDYPTPSRATEILSAAEARGIYVPRTMPGEVAPARTAAALPAGARQAGHLDQVRVAGNVVLLNGWADVPAGAGRAFVVAPADDAVGVRYAATIGRPDVVKVMAERNLAFSGFRLDVEYPSEEIARRAAAALCVAVEAPGLAPAVLSRVDHPCVPTAAR